MPLDIGPITIRNRIWYAPTASNFAAENGLPSETLAYFIVERAKGGVGLIDFSLVIPSPEPYLPLMVNSCIRGYDPKIVPGFRRIADMAHKHGAKVFAEVASWGAWSGGIAMSPVPSVQTHGTPQVLEEADIDEIVEYYGKTAKNVKDGGLDGVDLHATHGLFLNQTLSPLYNRRTDKYGGSTENRMRVLLKVIDRTREYVGNEIAVGLRLIGDELTPGGVNVEEAKKIAQRLDASGKVDFINMDIGIEPQQVHIAQAPLFVEPGYEVHVAAEVKGVVKKAVVGAVGRIHDPTLAERILSEGKADYIGMPRALIAEPEFAKKAMEGKEDDIRPCLSDNENCLGFLFKAMPIGCTVNAAVGREKVLGVDTLRSAESKKSVLVVGGGPAGMEAARIAALRGHSVTLYEKEAELGGRITLSAKLPGREEINNLTRWFKLQLERLGVKVVTGKEVTPETVEADKADVVVVATGSLPIRTGLQPFNFAEIPGHDSENVTSFDEALLGRVEVGKKVLILDDIGFVEGMGLAELLATRGKDVEVLARLPSAGFELEANQHIFFMYPRALKQGVKFSPFTFIKQILGRTVVAFNVFTNEERKIEDVDTVVLITGRVQNDKLYKELRGRVKELYAAGDCVLASMYMGDALRDGHRAGRQI